MHSHSERLRLLLLSRCLRFSWTLISIIMYTNGTKASCEQECIPVGCVPPAFYRRGVSLTETPTPPPGQRPPTLGQRPPRQRAPHPWTKTPPLDRDSPLVDRQTPVKTLPPRAVINFSFLKLFRGLVVC